MSLAACGGGGGGEASAPAASSPAPQNVTAPPVSSATHGSNAGAAAADLELANRLYKGDERTPDGFEVETRPSSVVGTLSTRHLKNTDFAVGAQASYEVCTDDLAEALDWSERMATWGGQYSDLVEVGGNEHLFELVRVPRADNTAMLRHRVFKWEYLDRSSSDLDVDNGAAGAMNQRPLTADELRSLAEYLWQFTLFNNSDYVVESSTPSDSADQLVHTIRLGQLVRGTAGGCDTVRIKDWTHTMNSADGSLTRSLSDVRSYQVKMVAGFAQSCTA
jgi:hypothetical protein